jgi:hypothetical protein
MTVRIFDGATYTIIKRSSAAGPFGVEMPTRKHLLAVNRSARAAGLDKSGLDAPTVELARDLARQMDAAGVGGPSGRVASMYWQVTRELRRAIARNEVRNAVETAAQGSEPVVAHPEVVGDVLVGVSPLERLPREKEGRP